MAAGSDHSLFVVSDGSLWGMGFNYYGALGLGDTTDRHVPVEILSSGVSAVSAGINHSMFIKSIASPPLAPLGMLLGNLP